MERGEARRPVGRPRGTGSRRVYSEVREKILRLELAPGSDLDEASLEREFSVSRTPVREALIRLASEGLVTLLANRGARVTPMDVTGVPELLEALELFHRVVLRWAAARGSPSDTRTMREWNQRFRDAAAARDFDAMSEANHEFHTAVARACGNRHIVESFNRLQADSLRLSRLSFASGNAGEDELDAERERIADQHDGMIEAIERGDPDAADDLARAHIEIFRTRVSRYLERSEAGDTPIAALDRGS